MAIDVDREFASGGKTLLDFLTFCVMGYRMEPVLAFLAADYRIRPTREGALAIFDCFCAPQAPARVRGLAGELPPRDLRLLRDIDRLRGDTPESVAVPRHLYEGLVTSMRKGPVDAVLQAGLDFDPALPPAASLPGGRMTEGQRAFVERVWQPQVRPRLVSAGFWRIATTA